MLCQFFFTYLSAAFKDKQNYQWHGKSTNKIWESHSFWRNISCERVLSRFLIIRSLFLVCSSQTWVISSQIPLRAFSACRSWLSKVDILRVCSLSRFRWAHKNMTDLQNNIETRYMLPVSTMLLGAKYCIDHYITSGSFGFLYHECLLTGTAPSIHRFPLGSR